MNFIQNTEKDVAEMMKVIGIKSIDDLLKDIPKNKLLKNLRIPEGISEMELKDLMKTLAKQNCSEYTSFLGAGIYNHFIPSVVNHLISRSEFYTAYTPYQPEASQGILQAMYEYQTLITELCGMDVANASLYDGSTALAEGMFMATKITQRNEVIISSTVHPEYRDVIKTYANARDIKVIEVGFEDGLTSIKEIENKISENTAAVLVQNPNFFGGIENLSQISTLVHKTKSLLVVCVVEPTSLGILEPPGKYGTDIVVGEAQSFGNPMYFGGPCLGFLATKNEFVRQIPGRIVGATVDAEGKRGFVLTLQAREQHIRRERATSNICSNEALNALAATVYLVTIGKNLKNLAEINLQKSHFVYEEFKKLGFEEVFPYTFYNEFVMRCRDAEGLNKALLKHKIIGGLHLQKHYPNLTNCLLFCVTEMVSRKEIEKMLKIAKGFV